MLKLIQKLLPLLALLLSVEATGKPDLESSKRYHIVCTLFTNGCVTDGKTANAHTPLYYLSKSSKEESTYWIFDELENGLFTIQNAATKQYITYDGQRTDEATDGETRRYVDMTDDVNGDYSLWSFHQQSQGVYAIRNAAERDHIWDVRTGSYVVGTYANSGSANSNQCFSIYDEKGTLVVEASTPSVLGINVTSWLDATTESMDRWMTTGTWKYNTGDGGSHYNNEEGSFLVAPFIESWHESSSGPLDDCSLSQQLTSLPAGSYTLMADMMAVRQSYRNHPNEPATNVVLYAGNAEIPVATGNDPPQRFSLAFTLSETSTIEVGVQVRGTNANWVAIDNMKLYFHGTEEELIAGERTKVEAELEGRDNADEYLALIAAAGDDFEQLEAIRKKIVMMPEADPIGKAATDLLINGRSPIYAKSTNVYLCSIPLSEFGSDMTATVSYTPKNGCGNLSIDGSEVEPGASYTFSGVSGGKNYTLSIRTASGTDITIPLTFTSLPVVKISGSFSNTYSEGYITVSEPDKSEPAEMLSMKAKWRGGITNGSDKHKRNYHVKLKDENDEKLEKKFFGLRKDNSWILEACQVDMSRIRNRTLTDLWNDFSTPPYYIDEEPKALTGTRGNFVELVLNDEYRGIYCMTENMDRKQMKLKKYDEENGVTHGQLWKSKDWSYSVFMGHNSNSNHYPMTSPMSYDNNRDMWDCYEVKYPDFEDYGNKTDWSTLYNAVDFVATASDEEFRKHAAEYFDLPLVIDYYILMETILSTDNHGKNMFFGVYDKEADKRITLAVWDMDATCGQRWSDAYYHQSFLGPEQDYTQFIINNEHGDYNLFRRLRNTDADNFNMKVRLRYQQLRQGELQTDRILQRFRNYLNEFKTAGSDQREYARWNGDSDIAGLILDFDNEMEYLTDWFTRRMNYLDEKRFDIASLPNRGDVNGDGAVDIGDAVAIVNHILKKPYGSFVESAADINGDTDIDIADAVAIVNLILKKSAGSRQGKRIRRSPN